MERNCAASSADTNGSVRGKSNTSTWPIPDGHAVDSSCNTATARADCDDDELTARRGACCREDAVFSRTELGWTGLHVCYAVFVTASLLICSWMWSLVCWPAQRLNSSSFLNNRLRASLTT